MARPCVLVVVEANSVTETIVQGATDLEVVVVDFDEFCDSSEIRSKIAELVAVAGENGVEDRITAVLERLSEKLDEAKEDEEDDFDEGEDEEEVMYEEEDDDLDEDEDEDYEEDDT